MPAEPIELALKPADVLGAWSPERPLAVLWSGGDSLRSRWTILACPRPGVTCSVPAGPGSWERIASLLRAGGSAAHDGPPLVPGSIGWLGYELGRQIEPAAATLRPGAPGADRPWPLAYFVRCDDALAYDHHRAVWWGVGGWRALAEAAERGAPAREGRGFTAGPLRSRTGRESFERAAARCVEYIRAGDIYQANLAHRLSGAFEGSTRSLFGTLVGGARPWYGAYVECTEGDDRFALAGVSPELFLEFDPATRRVTTRPMKGTRPGHADPEELRRAPKDLAELTMIVDLMRNDLGRVCEFGSVRVTDARAIEGHGVGSAQLTSHSAHAADRDRRGGNGVWQAVATVEGRLRAGLTVADLIGATFPGGSVTGAPKVRAMQIIGELEPVERGPYCGCVGYISDSGHAAFNIAIRTALVTGRAGPGGLDDILAGTLDYSVGAGIVADSNPADEWLETIDKASPIRAVAPIPEVDR